MLVSFGGKEKKRSDGEGIKLCASDASRQEVKICIGGSVPTAEHEQPALPKNDKII